MRDDKENMEVPFYKGKAFKAASIAVAILFLALSWSERAR